MGDRMWALVMFDLPVKTKAQRRLATKYRKMLLDLGFSQVQLSVYSKLLINASGLARLLPRLREIPPDGAVRILRLTDEQWAKAWRFYGPVQMENQVAPSQLLLINDEETNRLDPDSHDF